MKKGAAEWTPIYMLVVMIIAAILVVTLVKPMFRRAAATSSQNLNEAQTVGQAALFLFSLILKK
jgi:membrane protein implicated in regulation of membrane protease activity